MGFLIGWILKKRGILPEMFFFNFCPSGDGFLRAEDVEI